MKIEPTTTDLAYAAGMVDGEGCIHILYHRGRGHHSINVIITNTDPRVAEWLLERFGGRVHHPRERVDNWTVSARKAAAFLELVYPYLVIKKEQADLVLKLHRDRKQLSKDERHALKAQLMALHHPGRRRQQPPGKG